MKRIKRITCIVLVLIIALSVFSICAYAETGSIKLVHDDYGNSFLYAYRENGKTMKANKGQYMVWKVVSNAGDARLTVADDGSVALLTWTKCGWITVYAILYNTKGDQPVCSCKADLFGHHQNLLIDYFNYYVGAFYKYLALIPGYLDSHMTVYSTKK